ncbi:hypothetical protein ACSLVQ_28205, partial [Klebsiella pneumoniae]|uniref:hypothetical protein n=1 Tax=Klebsiella pneumoniae TaxID=573 RepID=UPI003EDFF869
STLDVLAGGHMYYRELFYIKQRAIIVVPPIAVAVLLGIHRFSEDAPRTKIDPFWLVMFAAGALSSGLNHSTQWAYSNCFMPVALYGSVVV